MAVWWEPIRTFLHQAGAVSVVSFVLVFPYVIFRHAHRKPIEEALDAMTSKAKIL